MQLDLLRILSGILHLGTIAPNPRTTDHILFKRVNSNNLTLIESNNEQLCHHLHDI